MALYEKKNPYKIYLRKRGISSYLNPKKKKKNANPLNGECQHIRPWRQSPLSLFSCREFPD